MSFTKLSSELSARSSIVLDNIFVLELMPFAPENYTKVYLYGKMLAEGNGNADNSADRMAKLLGITEDDVMEAFRYWEEKGAVRISAVPPFEVEYTPVRYTRPSQKPYKKKKYAAFNEMLLKMFDGKREFLPSELNEYYTVIEDCRLEPDAMLAVVSYCKRLKGTSIGWQYIVKVARNLVSEGCRTTAEVEAKLEASDVMSEEVTKLFRTLKIRRAQDFEDVRLYRKWTEEMGFKPGTVLAVAEGVYGEMKGLDTVLSRYAADGLTELKDIEEYKRNRDNLLALTKRLLMKLDVRYNRLDYYAETYVKEWLKAGFGEEALDIVADYCFRHEKKSCDRMSALLDECAKAGAVDTDAVRARFSSEGKYDKDIRKLLALAGVSGDVTTRDRDSYNIWVNYWNVPDELLTLAAKRSIGEVNPRFRMHSLIKMWHEKGVKTTEEADKTAPVVMAIGEGDAAKLNEKIRNITAEDI